VFDGDAVVLHECHDLGQLIEGDAVGYVLEFRDGIVDSLFPR
jgi:hypothetical protein